MRAPSLLVLFISIIFCAQANAQECSSSGFIKAADGYILKSVGAVASDGPVVQGGLSRTCGKWTLDGFASFGRDGGTANELDASVFYDTGVGPLKVQLAGAYYAVNLHDSLFDADDDIVEAYADVSLPLTWGRLKFAPLVRVGELIGVDDLPSVTLVQPGVRGSLQISDDVSASFEYRHSINKSDEYSTNQFAGALAWQASDRTAIRLGWEDTDRTRSVISLGVFHNFD